MRKCERQVMARNPCLVLHHICIYKPQVIALTAHI
nr:MAG TPA: hypothetical protein [Caudoviricetes sp.]